ncbi:MAG: sugar dehydratase, partial [Alphaproteobacteria bacterium]|nr:sugar dehydratase [Alphaproteobacteria bacterium]
DVQLSLAEAVAARKELRGEAFNFSYEIDIEIIEIVRRIGALMNVPLEPEIKADAKAEIRYMAVNADKARAMLGWKPLFTFEDGLLQSIEWYRAYLAKHPAS